MTYIARDSKGRPKVQKGGQKPPMYPAPEGLTRPPGIEDAIAAMERYKKRARRRNED